MPMEHLRVPKNSLKRVRVFKIELEFGGVGCFLLKYLEKNLSEQRREPSTNSTQIWCQRRGLNLSHIAVRGECSHHCSLHADNKL